MKTTNRKSSLWLQVAFGLFVLVLLGGLLRNQVANVARQSLPHSIAGLTLSESITGEQAMKEVNKLHGLTIPVQDAWIGHYGGQKAVVWVAQSRDDYEAMSLIGAMAGKIGRGNEYFGNLETLTVDWQKVYVVSDREGQKHYFYQTLNRVIWIAAPRGQEMAFVQEALKVL